MSIRHCHMVSKVAVPCPVLRRGVGAPASPASHPLGMFSSSMFIAGFPEYTQPMIEHLVAMKINHWDG